MQRREPGVHCCVLVEAGEHAAEGGGVEVFVCVCVCVSGGGGGGVRVGGKETMPAVAVALVVVHYWFLGVRGEDGGVVVFFIFVGQVDDVVVCGGFG